MKRRVLYINETIIKELLPFEVSQKLKPRPVRVSGIVKVGLGLMADGATSREKKCVMDETSDRIGGE